MEGASARSITRRSIPIPSPAVGGIPNSKALRKSSSRRREGSAFIAALTKLFEEPFPLVDRIVEFGKPIGDFAACHKELEAIDDLRILRVPPRQGRDVRRVKSDEGGLDQIRFDQLFEQVRQDSPMRGFLLQINAQRLCLFPGFGRIFQNRWIDLPVFEKGLMEAHLLPRRREVDLLSPGR